MGTNSQPFGIDRSFCSDILAVLERAAYRPCECCRRHLDAVVLYDKEPQGPPPRKCPTCGELFERLVFAVGLAGDRLEEAGPDELDGK